MVKAMATEYLTLRLRQVVPKIISVLASAALILSGSITASAAMQAESSGDWSSALWYGTTIILVLLLIGLLYYRRLRSVREIEELAQSRNRKRTSSSDENYLASTRAQAFEPSPMQERRQPQMEGVQVWEKPVEPEPEVYGAYRIDQEVSKLVVGKPHRMDVMSSRTLDDRRAIEGSLIKALESPDTSDEGRGRARKALEEYGFVARQCAMVLLGRDAWERSSAARTLGQIKAQSSLTALIEALHDVDSVVRNQAVTSLGMLKMPAAIGALLDIARRHSDIPATLLSESLSACSVESLSFLDGPASESAMFMHPGGNQPDDLERFDSFRDLPAGADDAELAELLAQSANADEQARVSLARQLASHPVQVAVSALTSMAINDREPAVRAAAVISLGSIDHESVFAPVLIALGDESRIVRAAAARTLSSLHLDRADAYVRVMEMADAGMLRRVASACVKTGIAAQAVDRLASEDRHQSYEAFSLFSLLARADETLPILEAIETHRDEEVRISAVRVLSMAGQTSVTSKLRDLASGEGMPENVRTAILEALYKLDQDQSSPDVPVSDNEPVFLHNSH
ncbi:MAG: HEAT repeat domain-containing protein [Pyrinomonadaceae bacterium]